MPRQSGALATRVDRCRCRRRIRTVRVRERVADVVEEAGVTKGAFYFHFASKDELAHAVISEQNRVSQLSGNAIVALARPALETMVLLCADLGRQLVSEPIVQAGIRLTTEAASFPPPVKDPYRDWLLVLEELIRRGIDEGDIKREIEPDKLARFIIPAYTGVQLLANVFSSREDLLSRTREMWEILLPAIVTSERCEELSALPRLIDSGERS